VKPGIRLNISIIFGIDLKIDRLIKLISGVHNLNIPGLLLRFLLSGIKASGNFLLLFRLITPFNSRSVLIRAFLHNFIYRKKKGYYPFAFFKIFSQLSFNVTVWLKTGWFEE
jgi:hypothetical protein